MSQLIAGCVAGLGWCFCSALGSLFTSCCGNDKPSTIPPSATSGRRRSVFLLVISLAVAFAYQYGVAPALQEDTWTDPTGVGEYLVESWTDGCTDYSTPELIERCSGNAGAYRAAGCAFLFFLLAAIGAKLKPTANREAWPAKYVLFLFACAATIFIPNDPLFDPIFLNVARIGAMVFVFFQQIILIDLAYNWNESWVERSDRAETDEGPGGGKKWLAAILASCAILYTGSIVIIGLMFHYFKGCPTNEAFISLTLIFAVVVTGVQLSGEESSLLTSAVMTAYATYLCLTAVSKNPDADCNPRLGEENVYDIILGIGFTLLSLAWTGWSFTADKRVGGNGNPMSDNLVEHEHGEGSKHNGDEERKVQGVVVTNPNYGSNDKRDENGTDEEAAEADRIAAARDDAEAEADEAAASDPTTFNNSWKLNCVLALVCCWYAMALTGWGSIEGGGDVANPDSGRASMWMIVAAQWLALSLYLWTLVAPKLFPDRDFS